MAARRHVLFFGSKGFKVFIILAQGCELPWNEVLPVLYLKLLNAGVFGI
jgi:hypothetical protein